MAYKDSGYRLLSLGEIANIKDISNIKALPNMEDIANNISNNMSGDLSALSNDMSISKIVTDGLSFSFIKNLSSICDLIVLNATFKKIAKTTDNLKGDAIICLK